MKPPIGYAPGGWRDAANYPPRKTPMRRWAAEFLIRNADFQAALGELRKLWRVARRAELRSPDSRYRRRARAVAEHFGLSGPPIGFRDDEPLIYPSFKVTPYALIDGVRLKDAPGEWFLGQDFGWGAALVFDLRKPVAPQLRVAEQILKGYGRAGVQRRARRDRHANYQAMLRVLDARTFDVSYSEIGRALFPADLDPADRTKKLRQDGERLRDGGYLELAALGADQRAASLRANRLRGP